MQTITPAEILKSMTPEALAQRRKERWAGWTLDAETRELIAPVADGYRVSLYERVDAQGTPEPHNAAEVLHWLRHVGVKSWATPAVLGGLAAALIDALCMSGRDPFTEVHDPYDGRGVASGEKSLARRAG